MKKNTLSQQACIVALAAFSSVLQVRADDASDKLKTEVVANYAAIAGYSGADAHTQALALKKALEAFTAAPSAELQEAAKQAWLAARLPYLQSQIIRVSSDEAGALDAAPADYMRSSDARPGGFRAIEFLLWGEDASVDGAGERSFRDFMKVKNGNAPRHAAYLNASADRIVEKMAAFAADWKADSKGNAREKFTSLPADEALKQILTNVKELAAEELAKNRIGKAYESREQRDESSNYSDMTHLDLIYDCSGMANVVAGAYVGLDKEIKVQGAGLLQLATSTDEKLGEQVKIAINRVMFSVTDFRPPFDRALLAPDDSPAREAIKEMMDALGELDAATDALAKALGIELKAKTAE